MVGIEIEDQIHPHNRYGIFSRMLPPFFRRQQEPDARTKTTGTIRGKKNAVRKALAYMEELAVITSKEGVARSFQV